MYDMKSFFKEKKYPSSSSIVPSQQVLKQKEMEERVGKGWKDVVMNMQRFWNSHWSGIAAEDKE